MFKHILKRQFGPMIVFNDGGDGGDGGGGGESWHSEYSYFSENPDAAKSFEKYGDANEAFKGAHEAIKKVGEPYRLPKDLSKLTDEQKATFSSDLAKLRGVPEKPEGYEFEIPDGIKAAIDSDAMGEFQKLCHRQGKTLAEGQDMLNIQLSMVDRLNGLREQTIKDMTDKNYNQFVKEQGSESNAIMRMNWVKEFLQTKCTNEEGELDSDMWESFQKRIMHEDRVIELPLLRALSDAAQLARGQGGAPMGAQETAIAQGALSYPEMKKK